VLALVLVLALDLVLELVLVLVVVVRLYADGFQVTMAVEQDGRRWQRWRAPAARFALPRTTSREVVVRAYVLRGAGEAGRLG
jgi:hypothetical protein